MSLFDPRFQKCHFFDKINSVPSPGVEVDLEMSKVVILTRDPSGPDTRNPVYKDPSLGPDSGQNQ